MYFNYYKYPVHDEKKHMYLLRHICTPAERYILTCMIAITPHTLRVTKKQKQKIMHTDNTENTDNRRTH